ncbi:MAG: GNAT family N-acetyltransferase [Promethearchaeota archaeon]
MIIREANIDDSIELTKMYRKLYDDEFSKDSIIPIGKTQFLSKIFFAQEENKVVGFIWINFVGHGESKYGYLEELYVKPAFRDKNYGTMLVEKAKEFFREKSAQAVFVSIEKNNEEGIRFYKKCDFNKCEGSWYYFTNQSDQS